MASNLTVFVKNISGETPDKEVEDFFTFCGKITAIQVTPGEGGTKDASVTFEKETAAKTAQLLNNTELHGTRISVIPADGKVDDGTPHTTHTERDADEITQEEKPRSRILAEYLAHGYVIGDATLQRAIDLDHQHNVTSRFMSTLQKLDQKYRAMDRAKAADQSYGITTRATGIFNSLSSYFEKATSSPTGQRLVKFYTESQRQVQDIHAEARRLAELKKEEHGGSAYKASGFERFFGKEKPAQTSTPSDPAATSDPCESMSNATILGPLVDENGEQQCSCGMHGARCICDPEKCVCVNYEWRSPLCGTPATLVSRPVSRTSPKPPG
ncbi:hypothetical protein F4779DRAFT_166756 [Xylariaceae sp. FL0662B]|nr:hypothetical protein F4779DRAFT_166756 [Xylariaceae sp. FL0662B]